MPVRSISRSIFSLLLLCCALPATAQDTTTAKPKRRKEIKADGHQLRIGVDIVNPIMNAFMKTRQNYELGLDYYFKKEVYLVAEGGFGDAKVDYTDLKYTTNSTFVRVGVDKCMLQRLFPGDWDMAFIGMRYGLGMIQRGPATYTIDNPLWGPTTGTIDSRNFTAHWAEITAGVRVELLKGFVAGWNVRAKFMLNAKSFEDLSPAYISGYGKGDKSTAFDFNFYLCYALRWGGNKTAAERSAAE